MSSTVYLNGQYVPYEEAKIPVEDRAFLFADGIYEVVRVYGGRPFDLEPHLRRLARSARELRLPEPDPEGLTRVTHELIRRNGVDEGTVYYQISRGVHAPRAHAFPGQPVEPTVLVLTHPLTPEAVAAGERRRQEGVTAITVPEQRWARCDIKSVSLLPNVLAKQQAAEQGAYEALFVRDGFVIEGSSSNVFAVIDGAIVTYPACNYILNGIARQRVIRDARSLGYTVLEQGIPLAALDRCQELFVTSTTSEVTPVVAVDGRPIGDGKVGPVVRALQQAYRAAARG
ncbi:D-amino-acid transaminase [Symbiobacterium thermophilum]|uniref:D-amino-acid transaminase n=1 Tax=Symbiobacterium thermophilum TaxID=2734 RepID=UPI002357D982|nr:D-amino-acid transaminase [Symbiobacterium thermophilum]